jgi:hypothetical protein
MQRLLRTYRTPCLTLFTSSLLHAMALLPVLAFVGCGSGDDKFKAAMNRSRSDDEELPPPPAKESEKKPVETDSAEPVTAPVAAPPPAAVEQLADIPAAIESRRPVELPSDLERRRRAASNLQAIHKGLESYVSRVGRYPPTVMKNSDGVDVLSWRVAILPDLGLKTLYDQFHLEEPWDSPHNKELLKRIPDCFVSPDRFDEKTNYVALVLPNAIFGVEKSAGRGDIIDSFGSVLTMIEFDDEVAQPWTSTKDYEPSKGNLIAERMGHLRGDGTIAIWGSGMLTYLPKKIDPYLLLSAVRINDEDSFKAGMIHRPLVLEDQEASDGGGSGSVAAAGGGGGPALESALGPVPGGSTARVPVPSATEIKVAQQRVTELYLDRWKQAKTPAIRQDLVRELLQESLVTEADRPIQYALLVGARSMATELNDFDSALLATDGILYFFEVEKYQERSRLLNGYLPQMKKAQAGGDMSRMTPLVVETLRSALAVDDYEIALGLAEKWAQFESKRAGSERVDGVKRPVIGQLRQSIAQAKQEFSRMGGAISTHEKQPKNDQAAFQVGRFLCLVKGNWKEGASRLKRGGIKEMQVALDAESRSANKGADFFNTANRWWEAAEAEKDDRDARAYRYRARTWYQQAIAVLPDGRDKLLARKRVADTEQLLPTGPLEIVQVWIDRERIQFTAIDDGGRSFKERVKGLVAQQEESQ